MPALELLQQRYGVLLPIDIAAAAILSCAASLWPPACCKRRRDQTLSDRRWRPRHAGTTGSRRLDLGRVLIILLLTTGVADRFGCICASKCRHGRIE